jgi:YidC/Oxa1 family membrane protein insertase
LFNQGTLNITWHAEPVQHQSDVEYERAGTSTNICFYEDDDFDYISSNNQKKFEKPVQWIAASQQFFSVILRAKNNFQRRER